MWGRSLTCLEEFLRLAGRKPAPQGMKREPQSISTRRAILKRAGGLLAATTAARSAQPAGPVMTQLSSYMSQASTRTLPNEVVEKAKHHILDTFAAMISGHQLPPGRAALQFVRAY